MFWKRDEDLPTEFEEGREYTNAELASIADAMLREDQHREMCRECGEQGEETGDTQIMEQEPTDVEGTPLVLEFAQLRCSNGHEWATGEGKAKGIGGKNPILFEEHLQQRRRREIYTTIGTPDPSIVAGIYNRTHPQGRKVNSLAQRQKNGASWYR